MRCARCDAIVVPQAVGLTRDGDVVFGWCLDCLAEEECILVEVPGAVFGDLSSSRATRPARSRPRDREGRARRLAVSWIAGLMGLWGLILLAMGLARLRGRPAAPGPLGLGSARLLLAGGGVMAGTSLLVWATTLDRSVVLRILLKAVQVGAAVLAFATLVWGVVDHVPRRDPVLVGIVALALGASWAAYRFERRDRSARAAWTAGGRPTAGGLATDRENGEIERL